PICAGDRRDHARWCVGQGAGRSLAAPTAFVAGGVPVRLQRGRVAGSPRRRRDPRRGREAVQCRCTRRSGRPRARGDEGGTGMIRFAPPTDETLLVVDDEPPVRRAISRQLERAGYRVRTAADSREARAELHDESFALALCDIDMPGESGLILVEHIAEEHPDTAVMMVTGYDDPGVAQVALDRGAYGYVIKPFERNELLINVANALRRRSLELVARAAHAQLERLVEERTAELRRSREELVQRLAAAADFKDPETSAHLQRMARYSELLAQLAGLPAPRCELLRLAAPMHDIGKIGNPYAVLTKQGRYDDADRAVMQEHPAIG